MARGQGHRAGTVVDGSDDPATEAGAAGAVDAAPDAAADGNEHCPERSSDMASLISSRSGSDVVADDVDHESVQAASEYLHGACSVELDHGAVCQVLVGLRPVDRRRCIGGRITRRRGKKTCVDGFRDGEIVGDGA